MNDKEQAIKDLIAALPIEKRVDTRGPLGCRPMRNRNSQGGATSTGARYALQ